MTRPSGRTAQQIRPLTLQAGASRYAEGSCLVTCGGTRVLCTASVEQGVPPFLRNTGKGWVTAEYGMLPRSTHSRMPRESAKGKVSGRTQEIQRLIGRSLRAVTDLAALGERQIVLDCDVIEADGGTRTASITGSYVALHLAMSGLVKSGVISKHPLHGQVAAISAGILGETPVIDLDYAEDSTATMDANFVLTSDRKIVEIQCTAEEHPVTEEQFHALLALVKQEMAAVFDLQRKALAA